MVLKCTTTEMIGDRDWRTESSWIKVQLNWNVKWIVDIINRCFFFSFYLFTFFIYFLYFFLFIYDLNIICSAYFAVGLIIFLRSGSGFHFGDSRFTRVRGIYFYHLMEDLYLSIQLWAWMVRLLCNATQHTAHNTVNTVQTKASKSTKKHLLHFCYNRKHSRMNGLWSEWSMDVYYIVFSCDFLSFSIRKSFCSSHLPIVGLCVCCSLFVVRGSLCVCVCVCLKFKNKHLEWNAEIRFHFSSYITYITILLSTFNPYTAHFALDLSRFSYFIYVWNMDVSVLQNGRFISFNFILLVCRTLQHS